MARKKIVAGNWKMNKTFQEGLELTKQVLELAPARSKNIMVLATPFIHLAAAKNVVKKRKFIHIAAQNCHQEAKGAFTGETSLDMIESVGATYVILGHSERRQFFAESDALLAAKVDATLAKGLTPIFCCGEALDIREAGTHEKHVSAQIQASLFHLDPDTIQKVVIAYEPIWAIGTGKTASSDQAQAMHKALRSFLKKQYGAKVANNISILYGGSCNAKNAAELFAQPDVDGGLIGGASLVAADFLTIFNAL